jgi:serine acetyltransferase
MSPEKLFTHRKGAARRILNRVLHLLARILPGSTSLRPMLHRWRGVRIGRNVFIGDDVYIENEYPEAIEIEDNVEIALRTVILAHLKGPGKIVIKQNAWIGACCLISTVNQRTLTIGEGAVIGAGSIITNSLSDRAFVKPPRAQVLATASVSMPEASNYMSFFRGLRPARRDTASDNSNTEAITITPRR